MSSSCSMSFTDSFMHFGGSMVLSDKSRALRRDYVQFSFWPYFNRHPTHLSLLPADSASPPDSACRVTATGFFLRQSQPIGSFCLRAPEKACDEKDDPENSIRLPGISVIQAKREPCISVRRSSCQYLFNPLPQNQRLPPIA